MADPLDIASLLKNKKCEGRLSISLEALVNPNVNRQYPHTWSVWRGYAYTSSDESVAHFLTFVKIYQTF